MDPYLSLLKSNLTQEEYNGYLKGSAALYVLGINSRKNNGCAFVAKQYPDELMKSGDDISQETKKPEASLNENGKNAPNPDKKQTPAPKTAKGGAVLNADEVRKLYIEKNLSAKECCETFGVSLSAFGRFLRKHGILKFPKGGAAVAVSIPKTTEDIALDAELDAAALAAARDILSSTALGGV